MIDDSPPDDQQDKVRPEPPPYPGAPRWVKITAWLVLLLVGLVLLAILVVDGDHGPGRHVDAAAVGEAGASIVLRGAS